MKITAGDWETEIDGGFAGLFKQIMNVEAMAMERATDETYERLTTLFMRGSRIATTAFVWVLRKREQPTLRFGDVEFVESSFTLALTEAEISKMKAEAAEAANEEADPPGADEAQPGEAGDTPTSETSTSPTSSTSSTSEESPGTTDSASATSTA